MKCGVNRSDEAQEVPDNDKSSWVARKVISIHTLTLIGYGDEMHFGIECY